jgi:hypothetical protein
MSSSKPPSVEEFPKGVEKLRLRANAIDRLSKFAKTTHTLLCKISKNKLSRVPPASLAWVTELYRLWMNFFLDYYVILSTGEERLSASLFAVLAQGKFLTKYDRMMIESSIESKLDTERREKLFICTKIDKYRINMLKQSDTVQALLYISRKICTAEWEELPLLKKATDALFTRISTFFCQANNQDILDAPDMTEENGNGFVPNERYRTMTSIYLFFILRRFRNFDRLKHSFRTQLPVAIKRDKIQKWFETDVCDYLGEESVLEMYDNSKDEAYLIEGDREWIQASQPFSSPSLGPRLQSLRPGEAEDYFSADRISQECILAGAADAVDIRGRCAQIFVCKALSTYINIKYNVPDWKTCVVISNRRFFGTATQVKLLQGRLPFIVAVVSRFWVYNINRDGDLDIWVTDNIYDAFGMWLYILKDQYNSLLLGYDLGPLSKNLFP